MIEWGKHFGASSDSVSGDMAFRARSCRQAVGVLWFENVACMSLLAIVCVECLRYPPAVDGGSKMQDGILYQFHCRVYGVI